MNSWRNFLDSLASRGGSILVLLIATATLGILALRMQAAGEAASLVRTTFAGFSGALLMALTNLGKANAKGTFLSVEQKLDPEAITVAPASILHTLIPRPGSAAPAAEP